MQRSTIQLLRFHFSFLLLPIYLFALGTVPVIHVSHAVLVFFILHILVYPASNGYNSYMDRDVTPVGAIKNPLPPTRELFVVTVLMDAAAITLSLLIGYWFTLGTLLYILASRAYSYRGIRLKKYPFGGYFTVVVFQGGFTYALVLYGCSQPPFLQPSLTGMLASSLLIGGIYPLTQIYQHEADAKDGVNSISRLLGYRGTFVFCGAVYILAFTMLALDYFNSNALLKFVVLATCMLPVPVYFISWARKVWKDTAAASFSNTMTMNLLASVCTNLGFLILVTWKILTR